jgi:predicted phage terminase large subunit-like protein
MTPQELLIRTKYDFRFFVRRCFFELNPTTDLDWNWHLDYLCWLAVCTMPPELNPLGENKIKRLLINVPPRSLKSETFSVAYTCFLQGHIPSEQMLVASYASSLAKDLHQKARQVMESDWYRQLFPHTQLQFSTKTEWKTTQNGHRQTVTVGGTTTGLGGNYLIADDIMSADIARSDAERKTANDWFSATFSNRLNNPKDGVIIVIMQRLHQDDTTGYLTSLPNSNWHHVVLPVKFSSYQMVTFYNELMELQPDDLLFPKRWDETTLSEMQSSMTPTEFAGQYMQTPVPAEGTVIPVDKFEVHTDAEVPPLHLCTIVQSWDTASKAGKKNDYSVCTTWAYTPKMSYLLDILRIRLEYPQLKPLAFKHAKEWNPHTILIEDKNNGTTLLQDFKNEMQAPTKAVLPKDKKEVRAERVAPLIDAGNVSLQKDDPHLADFLMECAYFPNGKNDDMVDTMTQYLDWVRDKQQKARVQISVL